jgi:hypothetical protein
LLGGCCCCCCCCCCSCLPRAWSALLQLDCMLGCSVSHSVIGCCATAVLSAAAAASQGSGVGGQLQLCC